MNWFRMLLLSLLLGRGLFADAQGFNFQLTGNPVNTTGWTSGPQSFVDNDVFVLTNNLASQAGYIYYATPQNLTNCSQFTVSFDFRITNSSIPTADGICFWYMTNPPSGFTVGGGIGLPNNPDGLLLILDTYDNDGTPNNPLVSLRKLDGTSNYLEGSATGQLAPDQTNQAFITDGNWHTCVLKYNFGAVTVAFDGNPPLMTGTTTLGLNGYFGFSAGTGASWAKHQIKNVSVTGAPEPDPPAGHDVTYCQGVAAVPLTATGTNMSWFTTPTGGTALPGAPTPSTAVAGTFNWYVSQAVPGCNVESQRDTVTVTVNPKPAPPVIGIPNYCSGQAASLLTITTGTNVLWYSQATGGTGSPAIPVVSTAASDTLTWYVTQTNATTGCESDRAMVNVIVHQTPSPDFSYTAAYGCHEDSIRFNNLTTGGADRYSWSFGDGLEDTATNPVHIYIAQNTYTVKLRASNQNCTDSTIKIIEIAHPLQAAYNVSADTVCVGSTINFTNTSVTSVVRGTNPSWLWDFGDGNTATLQSPAHTFSAPGRYPVVLVVKDGVPCTDTMTRIITVDSLPQLTLSRSDTSICQGEITTFLANYTHDGLSKLQWNFGENTDLVVADAPTRHAFEQPGTYTITLNGQYRVCPGTSASMQLLVKPMPVINLGPDTSICLDAAPLPLADAINAGNPKASWLWSNGAKTPTIQVRHDGRYTATVTIDQCSASDEIVVVKDCRIDVPNSFTPNGDGVNDYFFPRQYLSEGATGFTMTVYNRWGQKVFETSNLNGRGWDGKFNDKVQPVGAYIYMIKVAFKNGRFEEYNGNVTLLR